MEQNKEKLGFDYEEELKKGFKTLFPTHVVNATKKQDTHEGTDFFVNGIRIDTTYAFSEKKRKSRGNLIMVSEAENGMFIGIRTGNGYKKFKEPVVVIGHDTDDNYMVWAWIIPKLKSMVTQSLWNSIVDKYCEYLDSIESA